MQAHERLKWLKDRRKGVGGSDAAAILGVSKFRNEWSVFTEKQGLRPVQDPDDEPLHLLLGRLMEPVVATLYERTTGNRLIEPKGLLVHPEFDCIVGTPDRLVIGQERGCEIKTVNPYSRTQWGEPGTDQVPDEYLIQSQHYAGLTGYGVWDVPVLFSGARFEVYTVPRDSDFIAWMYDRLVQWWKLRIIDGVAPEVDASNGCAEYIKARYPRNTAPLLTANDHLNELGQRLLHLKAQMDVLDKESTLIENTIKLAIGEAEGMAGTAFRCTYKRAKDSVKPDWEKVARELAKVASIDDDKFSEIVASHNATKPGSRRFLFKQTEGEATDE